MGPGMMSTGRRKPDASPLAPSARVLLEELVAHESGHAVAAVELLFDLEAVEVRLTEGRACGLPSVSWIPAGETRSNASKVQPGNAGPGLMRKAATVALAGSTARRMFSQRSDAEADWKQHEASDTSDAFRHLGLQGQMTVAQLISARKSRATRRWEEGIEASLEAVASEARTLLARPPNWNGVLALAAALLERVSGELVPIVGETPATVLSAGLSGDDATRIVRAAQEGGPPTDPPPA